MEIIAKDKLKQEVEKKNNLREQQVTNDKKGKICFSFNSNFRRKKTTEKTH